MIHRLENPKGSFDLEALEPRIMLAADAGADMGASEVVRETMSAAEFDEINQRSDKLSYQAKASSIFDFEKEENEPDESEKTSGDVSPGASVDGSATVDESQVGIDGNFVFNAKADENDLLLRLNPDNPDRLELLDHLSLFLFQNEINVDLDLIRE